REPRGGAQGTPPSRRERCTGAPPFVRSDLPGPTKSPPPAGGGSISHPPLSAGTYVRHGWPRSPGHGGSAGGACTPATTGSTRRDGRPISFTTRPCVDGGSNSHCVRASPGAPRLIRMREPAPEDGADPHSATP